MAYYLIGLIYCFYFYLKQKYKLRKAFISLKVKTDSSKMQ